MLRVVLVILGLLLCTAFPAAAKATDMVDCHHMDAVQIAPDLPKMMNGTSDRRGQADAPHGAPVHPATMDCCLGANLCRLACTAMDIALPQPVIRFADIMTPDLPADSLPLEGHAVAPLLGPPRAS